MSKSLHHRHLTLQEKRSIDWRERRIRITVNSVVVRFYVMADENRLRWRDRYRRVGHLWQYRLSQFLGEIPASVLKHTRTGDCR